jgi:hypothetical protein
VTRRNLWFAGYEAEKRGVWVEERGGFGGGEEKGGGWGVTGFEGVGWGFGELGKKYKSKTPSF